MSTNEVRAHYLTGEGVTLTTITDLVVRDLVSTNAVTYAQAETLVAERASEFMDAYGDQSVDDGAAAVWIAEAVQEDLIEGHGSAPRLVTWPACPDHPQHPLWSRRSGEDLETAGESDLHDPVWTCSRTDRAIAEIGRLERV